MSGRVWVADLHLGHEKVSRIRGFSSTDDHDAVILDQLSNLPKGWTVWVLGDISGGTREGEERALTLLKNVKESTGLELHLIAGNHDSVSSIHRTGFKHQRRFLEAFESVQQFGRVRVNGGQVLMCHFPFARSGDGPARVGSRHDEFRLNEAGVKLLHGHTHQTTPHMNNDRSQFCVSWDVFRRPVTDGDLAEWG